MMGEQYPMMIIRPKLCRGPAWQLHGVEHCCMHYSTQFDRVGFIQLVM
jgi:hypothetical protein